MGYNDLRMEIIEGVRKMMKESRKTMVEVADEMGYASVSGLTNKFAYRDMKIGIACEIAEVCGYEVVLRSKDRQLRDIVLVGGLN